MFPETIAKELSDTLAPSRPRAHTSWRLNALVSEAVSYASNVKYVL